MIWEIWLSKFTSFVANWLYWLPYGYPKTNVGYFTINQEFERGWRTTKICHLYPFSIFYRYFSIMWFNCLTYPMPEYRSSKSVEFLIHMEGDFPIPSVWKFAAVLAEVSENVKFVSTVIKNILPYKIYCISSCNADLVQISILWFFCLRILV